MRKRKGELGEGLKLEAEQEGPEPGAYAHNLGRREGVKITPHLPERAGDFKS
jgi:hypothetical protein